MKPKKIIHMSSYIVGKYDIDDIEFLGELTYIVIGVENRGNYDRVSLELA